MTDAERADLDKQLERIDKPGRMHRINAWLLGVDARCRLCNDLRPMPRDAYCWQCLRERLDNH